MWQKVANLLSLAGLNSKIASDALDDASRDLAECSQKMTEAEKRLHDLRGYFYSGEQPIPPDDDSDEYDDYDYDEDD